MIQRQIDGEDYRLLVIGGKLRFATKRIPAFITGDGKKTVQQIIEQVNSDPRRDVSNPAHTLKPIVIDQPLKDLLKENNLTLDHVPKKDETVQVRKEASMSRGGMTEDFTDQVNPQIRNIVESIAQTLHVNALGVDVLCKDLSKPLTEDNGSIIEFNTMPEAYLNAFPTEGKQYPEIGEIVVQGLVDVENPTKKIVFLGGTLKNVGAVTKVALKSLASERVGLYSEGKTYINDVVISEDLETDDAIQALKLNASLSTIIFHYPSVKEANKHGLGFDTIDKLFVEKGFADDNKSEVETLRGYANLGIMPEPEII